MRKIFIPIMFVCFVVAYVVLPASIAEARISEKYKSDNPEEAFLDMMKEHYTDCETKDHLEDFVYLGLRANLESYDIGNVPKIDSVGILPPEESFTFKGGLIEGFSKNLAEKAPYDVVGSTETLDVLKQNNLLNEYNEFRAELFNFDNINSKQLVKFAKLLGANYIIIPRIYDYSIVITDAKTVATSSWAMELNLISVKELEIEWTLVGIVKSVDIQMDKLEQLSEYAKAVLVTAIYGGSSNSSLGSSRRRLKERTERLAPDYRSFSIFLTDIILTLDKYELEGKMGIPEKEREYKCWLRSGTFPRLEKVIY